MKFLASTFTVTCMLLSTPAMAQLSDFRKAQLEELAFYISNPAVGVGDKVIVHAGTIGCATSGDLLWSMGRKNTPRIENNSLKERCGLVPKELRNQTVLEISGPNALAQDQSGAEGWVATHTLQLEAKGPNPHNVEDAADVFKRWAITEGAQAYYKGVGLMGPQWEEDRMYRTSFIAAPDYKSLKLQRSLLP